jgi:hypothetical protein
MRLCLLALIFAALQAPAHAMNLGKELHVLERDGHPVLTFKYSRTQPLLEIDYATDAGKNDTINGEIELALVNLRTSNPGTQFFDVGPEALSVAHFRTADKISVEYSLDHFKDLGAVYVGRDGTHNMVPMYWLKLGEVCATHPEAFYNIDENRQGCP